MVMFSTEPLMARTRCHGSTPLARSARLLHTVVLALLLVPTAAAAGLYQPPGTVLKQFGFATGAEVKSLAQYNQYFEITSEVIGAPAIVRTSIGWDPAKTDVPGFDAWNATVLDPARAAGITILPGVRTLNLDRGGYRMPSDTQWAYGLRQIVQMYGPGGIYANGGTYVRNGKPVRIAAHPGFTGLTDFELWNEPNSPTGNLGGTMTPTRMDHLLTIGAAAMRDEAAKLGFSINIIGPAIDGMDLNYLAKLWQADNQIFQSVDTLSLHGYSRFPTATCNPYDKRCVTGLQLIRDFLDAHGGAHVHLGTTEGGFAGSQGTCLGPQVYPEQIQSDLNEEALQWLRARPSLNLDFWITFHAIDGTATYGYACDSGIFDHNFWRQKLGVVRADLSLKPWGARYRELIDLWRSLEFVRDALPRQTIQLEEAVNHLGGSEM